MGKDKDKQMKFVFSKDGKEIKKPRKKHRRMYHEGVIYENEEASKQTQVSGEDNQNMQTMDGKEMCNDFELEARREKRKKRKEKKDKDEINSIGSLSEISENKKLAAVHELSEKGEYAGKKNEEERDKSKKEEKKKRKREKEISGEIMENEESAGRKRRHKKRHNKVNELQETIVEEGPGNGMSGIEDVVDGEKNSHSSRITTWDKDLDAILAEDGNQAKKKGKKKKTKLESDVVEEKGDKEKHKTEENAGTTDISGSPTLKKTDKRVSFSENVEIFPSSINPSTEKELEEDGLVRGKRFSKEEDEMVKKAVLDYIEVHGLGDKGLEMVLNCSKHPEIKNCWKEIGKALPWRPYQSVYYRAHILFERDEKRKWTAEEYELIRNFHKKHGSDWKMLADAIGKHRFHVKDTWRRIKLPNEKKGRWSQDEYETLFNLVNTDLRMRAFEERKSKHGMLRDNICWESISDKLTTRSNAICCVKWYSQLTSPMVAEGIWADVDDYRLVDVLRSVDSCSIEDVDWDNLLEHRSGDVCRKRWNQMILHIGEHGNKSFAEQVEVLSKRYSLDVLEAREIYESKPIVS